MIRRSINHMLIGVASLLFIVFGDGTMFETTVVLLLSFIGISLTEIESDADTVVTRRLK
jgi:hypothetical protein